LSSVKLFVAIVFLLGCANIRANDLDHRKAIQNAMMVSIQDPARLDYPFLSTVDIIKENGRFTRSSGWYLIDVQPVASSAYDPSVAYDITNFYKSKNTRVRFISNYQIPRTGFFVSYGFDSGTKAEKLEVSKSFFVGASQAFNPHKSHFFFYSVGRWYGEKITQKPCLDTYDREYWCPSLTAWKDRPIIQDRQESYADLRYIFVF
jgi:hypothetical protein